MSYENYLKSKHWSEVKELLSKKRKKRCFLCRRYRYLQLHHISYKNIGKETEKDLVWLCVVCHKANHFGPDKEKIQKWIRDHANKVVVQKHFRRGQKEGESLFAFKLRMRQLKGRNFRRWKCSKPRFFKVTTN